MDDIDRMPGDAEAAAAVAGTQETYGHGLAIGDRVTYRLAGWADSEWETGRICAFGADGHFLCQSELDGTYRAVNPAPWPVGNVLPF
jgi:hypothetical protein